MRVRCIHCSTDSQVSLLALEKTGGEFQCPACEKTFNALRGSRTAAPKEAGSAPSSKREPSAAHTAPTSQDGPAPEETPAAAVAVQFPTQPESTDGFPPAYDLLKAAGGLLESGEAPILQAEPDPDPSDGPLTAEPTPVEPTPTPEPEPAAANEELGEYEDFALDPLSVIGRPSIGALPVGGKAGPVKLPATSAPDPEELFRRKKAAEDARDRKLAEQEARKAEERKVRAAQQQAEREQAERERAAARERGVADPDDDEPDSDSIVIEDQLLKETAETIDPGLSTQPDIPIEPRPRNLEASYEEYEDESDFIPQAPQPLVTRSGMGAPPPPGAPVRRPASAAMRPDTPRARPQSSRRSVQRASTSASAAPQSGLGADAGAQYDLNDPRLDAVPGALGKRIWAALAVIGVLFFALVVFVLVANDFKLRPVGKMVVIAFGGGAAAVPTPETVSEHFEVIDFRIYKLVLSDRVTVAVVQGTLENRSDLIYDRVQVRVTFSGPDGSTVAEVRRPAGNVYADKRMETFTSPAALDAAYRAEGTDGRNLGLAPFTRFPFQVIFLDPPAGCCFDYSADVKVVGGEPRMGGAPSP